MGDTESLFKASEAFWGVMRWAFETSPVLTSLLGAVFLVWMYGIVFGGDKEEGS